MAEPESDRSVWIERVATDELPVGARTFAVKDNIDVVGFPTTAGAPAFAYRPDRSAPVVQRLVDAGAVVAGKTNLDQFATGLSGTRSPAFGICRNPINPEYISGGSSSGSAVAVARGDVAFALGTDTAGSGRVPAACCGIVGLKPTRQCISTEGLVPASHSFDSVSIFARTCAEAAEVFELVDMHGAPPVSRSWSAAPRLGIPTALEWFGDADAKACFERAHMQAVDGGAEIVDIDFAPFHEAAALLYDSALVTERYASFGAFVERHPDDVDPAVRRIVLGAAHHDGVSVFRALALLEALRRAHAPVWDTIDALLLPTIARHPTIAEACADSIGTSRELGTYTNFVNPLGLCALAVPAGTRASGMPFGVSFIGPAFSDRSLLAIGAWFGGEPSRRGAPDCTLAVVGAHLRGQPLNGQLVDAGAEFLGSTTTSAHYQLFDLGLMPPKPGLVRTTNGGATIEVEVWGLDAAAFGRFVAVVPPPLAIGTIELSDGSWVSGFVCEPVALEHATEITSFGGWRAYLDRSA